MFVWRPWRGRRREASETRTKNKEEAAEGEEGEGARALLHGVFGIRLVAGVEEPWSFCHPSLRTNSWALPPSHAHACRLCRSLFYLLLSFCLLVHFFVDFCVSLLWFGGFRHRLREVDGGFGCGQCFRFGWYLVGVSESVDYLEVFLWYDVLGM